MASTTSPSPAVIGLDIGTTSVSAVAITANGRLLKSVTLTHDAAASGIPSDCAEQNPAALLTAALAAVKQAAAAAAGCPIAGIGLTGQMHSTLLLDAQDHPVSNVITWQDRRSLRRVSGKSLLDHLQTAATEEAMVNTGCRLSAGYLGTTLFSLKQLDQWPQQATHVSFVADWIASQLTAQAPVTDRSHAASSGLFDLVNDGWSSPLLNAAGVSSSLLPVVRDSGIPVGGLTAEMAEATGIVAGTPVCNSIGDNQASVLSCLPSGPDKVLINIGTGGQIVWRCNGFQRLPGMDTRYLPHDAAFTDPVQPASRNGSEGLAQPGVIDATGSFMLVGAGLCGGDSLAWVNRTIRSWLSAFGCELTDAEIWERLHAQLAQQFAAERGNPQALSDQRALICEPFFRGTRQDPARRGRFEGVDTENFTPAGVARSVLHGIANSMFQVYQQAARDRTAPAGQVILSGNGARRNPLLKDAVAQLFQCPVSIAPVTEEAAAGAAFLAGARLGIWNSISAARELNAADMQHSPGES